MQIVTQYGTMWARNDANINQIPRGKLGVGVYVLFDGSMPMYVGKGRIKESSPRGKQKQTALTTLGSLQLVRDRESQYVA